MGGWIAIGAVAGAVLALTGLAVFDRTQQLPLVAAAGRFDLAAAYADQGQTSGPGILVVALPVYWLAQLATTDARAYDIAALACLVPLAFGVVAASRATGVAARSGRELLSAAAVVCGLPVLACYVEAFHPADVVATAACLGALAAFARSRLAPGAVLLGVAVATRQWAVIPLAILVVLAESTERVRITAVAAATAIVITLPFAIAAPQDTIEALAAKAVIRVPLTAPGLVSLPESGLYLVSRYLPLVLAGVLCAWLYRRRARFTPELAVAALAAGLLLRPLIDPAGFVYYLAPGYAFGVLMRPRSLRYPLLGFLGGGLVYLRYRLAGRYPAVEGMVLGEGGRVLAVGGTLSVLVTLLIAGALGAALVELRAQVGLPPEPGDRTLRP